MCAFIAMIFVGATHCWSHILLKPHRPQATAASVASALPFLRRPSVPPHPSCVRPFAPLLRAAWQFGAMRPCAPSATTPCAKRSSAARASALCPPRAIRAAVVSFCAGPGPPRKHIPHSCACVRRSFRVSAAADRRRRAAPPTIRWQWLVLSTGHHVCRGEFYRSHHARTRRPGSMHLPARRSRRAFSIVRLSGMPSSARIQPPQKCSNKDRCSCRTTRPRRLGSQTRVSCV
jgi:hypothetical protein